MMLEFAMRNGDVLRLRDENFVAKDSRHYLNYTPHKTELSSERRVFISRVHKCVWGWYTSVYPRTGAIDNLQQVMIDDVLITPKGGSHFA